jgi:site-specific DNA-methyltransferase (adenine-specific)
MEHSDGLAFLSKVPNNSVDLILTDPPYIISHETGMDKQYTLCKDNTENVKTEEEWTEYIRNRKRLNLTDKDKKNFLRYGSVYGKKYAVQTNYGEWDQTFTIETLEQFVQEFYNKLRVGGTLIIWFDLWKISELKDVMERARFKQIRFIEWIKTNPQPLNAGTNYLTNCREIAILGVKGSKPTFNSRMDRGLYEFPMASGWYKSHPTQKNLQLFETLIRKHSNEGDLVMDTFLGGGTTMFAAKNTGRRFIGCEINQTYVDEIKKRL